MANSLPLSANDDGPGIARARLAIRLLSAAVVLLLVWLLFISDVFAGERCRAIDGDTLRCGKERVRLQSIYAPELKEPGGKEARQRLQQRIDSGDVRIERRGRDKYGRTLGRIYVDGQRVRQSEISPKAGRGTRSRR